MHWLNTLKYGAVMQDAKLAGKRHFSRWFLLALLGIYIFFSLGPILWLIISSLKSRADLFAMPPKWVFDIDMTGYESVFGVGAARGTASA